MASEKDISYMDNYQNILAPGKEPQMTKEYKPKIAQQFDKYLNPDSLKKHVLRSEKIQKIIAFYSEETKKPQRDIEKQVKLILDEIGLDRNLTIIRWCGMVITAMGKRISSGIYVNEKNLSRIKNGLGKNPVLYLPSHRSYLDFILMSYICFHYDIEIPGIAAGMDFHSMFGMGTILRRTGAFFMRRSFSGDDLYWDVFREYMYALITDYHIGVEFFIEGTRSRNFKSLVPKIGLLSMALQPFFMGEVSDVTVVPVSVSYEKVLEEQLFVYELLGVPKPKESLKGFVKALKIIDERFGRMYMDFGEPISVKEYFGNDLDRIKHASLAAHVQKLNKIEIQLIKGLANEVVDQQQRRIVITTFNLIAVYYSHSMCKDQSPSLHQLAQGVKLLKSMVDHLGAHVATDCNRIKFEIIETVEIHSNIVSLLNGDMLLVHNEIPMHTIDPKRLKGHALSKETVEIAVPMLSLQLYINPCMFWLATPAILVLALMKLQQEGQLKEISIDVVMGHVTALNRIFSNEFVFESKNQEKEFAKNLKFLENFGIFRVTNGQINFTSNEISELLLSTIAPFLCIYYQLTETILNELPNNEFTDKEILIHTQKRIEKLLLSPGSQYTHPYCLALDNLSIALTSFIQNGHLVKNRQSNMITSRRENLNDINKLLLNYCQLLPFKAFYKNTKSIVSKL